MPVAQYVGQVIVMVRLPAEAMVPVALVSVPLGSS
jgi:hypothetical protein